MKYRILKKYSAYSEKWMYYPQVKGWLFWNDIPEESMKDAVKCYSDLDGARAACDYHLLTTEDAARKKQEHIIPYEAKPSEKKD